MTKFVQKVNAVSDQQSLFPPRLVIPKIVALDPKKTRAKAAAARLESRLTIKAQPAGLSPHNILTHSLIH